jgi:hypothetical protein
LSYPEVSRERFANSTHNGAIEVAKFMKKQGEPMEKIMLYTGFTEVDVM